MRIINFSDNTTYVSDGESYRLDGKNHNIQRIDKKWMVDGRATTFSEMLKMGVAVKKTPEETQNDLDEALHEVRDCLLYTSPSPRDRQKSRMPSSA